MNDDVTKVIVEVHQQRLTPTHEFLPPDHKSNHSHVHPLLHLDVVSNTQ
jgi:hypothetical protein